MLAQTSSHWLVASPAYLLMPFRTYETFLMVVINPYKLSDQVFLQWESACTAVGTADDHSCCKTATHSHLHHHSMSEYPKLLNICSCGPPPSTGTNICCRVLVPFYPENKEMVLVSWDPGQTWLGHVQQVDTSGKTCQIFFYVECSNLGLEPIVNPILETQSSHDVGITIYMMGLEFHNGFVNFPISMNWYHSFHAGFGTIKFPFRKHQLPMTGYHNLHDGFRIP